MNVIGATLRRVFDHHGRPLNAEVGRAPLGGRPAPREVGLADLALDLGQVGIAGTVFGDLSLRRRQGLLAAQMVDPDHRQVPAEAEPGRRVEPDQERPDQPRPAGDPDRPEIAAGDLRLGQRLGDGRDDRSRESSPVATIAAERPRGIGIRTNGVKGWMNGRGKSAGGAVGRMGEMALIG